MYQEINFINHPIKFDGNTALTGCPPRFDMPKLFLYFQFGSELGNAVADDDFASNWVSNLFPLHYFFLICSPV